MTIARTVFVAALIIAAPCLITGCARPNLAAGFICEPPNAAPVLSSAYAKSSIADLQAAAKDGDRAAARVLGERYEQGVGVEPDLKQAVSWYETAAFVPPRTVPVYMPGYGKVPGSVLMISSGMTQSGDPTAMMRLSGLLIQGRGVPADPVLGQKLQACVGRS